MEANIEIAQSLFKQNKYQETIDTCNKILATDVNSIDALKLIAKSFLTTQNIEIARLYFNKVLNIKPNDYESIKDLGNTYQVIGESNTAKKYYQKAIAINSSYAPALTNLGSIELNTGNKQEALSLLIKATESDPQLVPAWQNLSNGYVQLGKPQEAENACRKSIDLNPNLFNSHFLLGTILLEQNKLQEAEQPLRKTIELKPDFFQAHLNLGAVLNDLGKTQEAELSIRKSIDLNPNLFNSHFLLGTILLKQNKLQEAESSTRKAIELNSDFAAAHLNLGTILSDLGNLQEAELSIRKSIDLNPNLFNSHFLLGTILIKQNKLQEAEQPLRKTIELKPSLAEAHSNLGNILRDLGNLQKAEIHTRKAIELNPDFAEAHSNLGGILNDLGNLQEAELFTRKAIALKPNYAIAHSNLGGILKDIGKFHEAINHFKKAIKLNNELSIAKSGLIETKGLICDWSDQKAQAIWLEKLGIEGSSVNPLGLFYYEDNPLKQLKIAKNFYKERYYKKSKPIANFKNEKIHIGYFSADFRAHPMMLLMGSMFKLHDKSKFQIYLYSFVKKEDEYTKLARESGCIFRDIKELNDIEAVELARSDQLDIAIDRMGYCTGDRMNIFSYRVAPIQIHYLAYPGTLGADNIDYLISDKIIIPNAYEKFYSEKILRMPSCYQCNDNTKEICKEPISRREFNLPDKGFVFTCFCANKKITPKEFDIWIKLLRKIEGSVLWLYQSNQYSIKNLIYESKNRNIDPDRLIFASNLPLKKHLARHSLGDLGLDTFNYNGHTTTSDALWAGLPVLTKIGESFAARVSASILNSLGMPELITKTEEEYEEKALYIARNPDELIRLKSKLATLKKISPLYNSELFTRALESKFIELIKNNNQ
ncbi:O-linked N-acetylglucosamine transferase family protein [Prochlorococcus marinus]|uniref:O-linked N-acetylglucosamine transferase family protein n=1 Tax=Prochlorococcus marinus TaxID=1219 RepID=UPI0015E88553|nr:tetratricopeptide repeat protein [Prochlorococcus marinus]